MYFRVLTKLCLNKRNSKEREVKAVRVLGHVPAKHTFLHNYFLDTFWY